MKDLFMCLLLNLMKHGNITEANLYKGGKFSSIVVETKDGIYTVNIGKEDKTDEN
jgi:hypothetical protein